jgi:quinate dehydrogenase
MTAQEGKKIYLFGYPISHSHSPYLQNTAYGLLGLPWEYTLFESTSIPEFLERLHSANCAGSAVTMPHKVAIIPHLDGLLEEGRIIGAVNTVVIKEEGDRKKYIGTNTDCIGIRDALLSKKPAKEPRSSAGIIIGGGGTTRAAVYALYQYLGCSPIYLVNRDDQEVQDVIGHFSGTLPVELIHLSSAEAAEKIDAPRYIVGAIPDFVPQTPAEILVRKIATTVFKKSEKGVFLDMCYKPRWTQLLEIARQNDWQTVEGLEAMLGQGIAQISIWSRIEKDKIPSVELGELVRKEVDRKIQK